MLSAVVLLHAGACFTFSVSRMGRLVIYYTPYAHSHRDCSVRCAGKFCAKVSFLRRKFYVEYINICIYNIWGNRLGTRRVHTNTKHDKTSLGGTAHHAYTNHELMVESEVPYVLLAHGSVSPA